MNAIQTWTRSPLWYEARRICDRHGVDDPEVFNSVLLDLAVKEFMREAQPFIDIKASALGMCTSFTVSPSGVEYNLSPQQRQISIECDRMIIDLGKRIGDSVGCDLALYFADHRGL